MSEAICGTSDPDIASFIRATVPALLATRITPHSRSTICPSFASSSALESKGRRECWALSRTHSLVCSKKAHEFETTGEPKHPAFPAQWFTAYRALSPVNRALLPPSSRRSSPARLDPSVGRSGPHAFAVRIRPAFVSRSERVHRILPPTSVTIAIRPLWSRTRKLRPLICPTAQAEFFAEGRVKWLNSFELAAENRHYAQAIFGAFCKHTRHRDAAQGFVPLLAGSELRSAVDAERVAGDPARIR
jgi:hypothetical protein